MDLFLELIFDPAIIIVFVVFMLIFGIISLALHILGSIGLFSIAKKNGMQNAWIAWIPLFQLYVVGTLVKDYKLFGKTLPNFGWVLVLANFICMALSCALLDIPYLSLLLSLIIIIFNLLVFHKFYSILKGKDSATLYTVLNLFFSPIILFVVRNSDVVMSPDEYVEPFGLDK